MSAILALVFVGSLAPRPTQTAQPTSRPTQSAEQHATDDVEGDGDEGSMSDEELNALTAPLDDAIVVEGPPTVAEARRASDRSVRDAFPAAVSAKGDNACATGLPANGSALAPSVLALRWEPGAAMLGGLVGFGTGYFYAGAPRRGLAFGIADTLLIASLAGSIWALNEHVVGQDRRTGLSLARDQRDRDSTESTLYALSWGLGIAVGVSRVFQAIDGYRAAKHTNDELRQVSFVPIASVTPGGGVLAVAFHW